MVPLYVRAPPVHPRSSSCADVFMFLQAAVTTKRERNVDTVGAQPQNMTQKQKVQFEKMLPWTQMWATYHWYSSAREEFSEILSGTGEGYTSVRHLRPCGLWNGREAGTEQKCVSRTGGGVQAALLLCCKPPHYL